MKSSIVLAAGLISLGALTAAYADDTQTSTQDQAQTQTQTRIAQRRANDPSIGGQQGGMSMQQERTDSQDRADPQNGADEQYQYEDPTGSDPATDIPYAATRGRPPYARGEAQ